MAEHMPFEFNDGGRAACGYKGSAGDCVVRAVAIAAELPYEDVYDAIGSLAKTERPRTGRKRSSPRNGVFTNKPAFKRYVESLGFRWTPTMRVGSGCTVHLCEGELPDGRLIVKVSKHLTAVIDGVVHDTHNPQRSNLITEGGVTRISQRCVYGYWTRH